MHTSLPAQASMKQGPFASGGVVLSSTLQRYYGPLRHPPGCRRLPGSSPVIRLHLPRLPYSWAGEGFPSSCIHRRTVPFPIPRRVPRRCSQVLRAFRGLRRDTRNSAPASSPGGVSFTRRQDSRHAADRSFAPPGGLATLRFGAERFHSTPAACYRAPWRLPGPDFHRLADASLCSWLGHVMRGSSSLLPSVPPGHAVWPETQRG